MQLLDGSKAEQYQIPIPIKADLRHYQRDGVSWLAFLAKYQLHGILCDGGYNLLVLLLLAPTLPHGVLLRIEEPLDRLHALVRLELGMASRTSYLPSLCQSPLVPGLSLGQRSYSRLSSAGWTTR
jgi:TATA-binding protein-associated factor